MSAVAGAGKAAQTLLGTGGVLALTLIVAAALVDGAALAWAQGGGLRPLLPGPQVRRWFWVTVAVAGLGWAVTSAPSALSGDEGAAGPPIAVVVAGAAGLGLMLGALLGWAQSAVLRCRATHPLRWIGISTAAWTPAMIVIFLGATAPGPQWSVLSVVGVGAATGAVAGATLGLISGALLPWLASAATGQRSAALPAAVLDSGMDRGIARLQVHDVLSGRSVDRRVQYARRASEVVIMPGRAEIERLWNDLDGSIEVELTIAGIRQCGAAVALRPGGLGYAAAVRIYQEQNPQVEWYGALFVRVRLHEAAADPVPVG